MSHKLLLADDSVTIQRVIELTFADEDIKVSAVSDGQQAVERIEAEPPDIILADVGMPKRDGYEVASYVKSRPKLAHIPVVLLTGAFEPVDQARAIAVGCDGVLSKPFEPQLVINRVKELLGPKPAIAAPRATVAMPPSEMVDPRTIGEAGPSPRQRRSTATAALAAPPLEAPAPHRGATARPEDATKPARSMAVSEPVADISVDTMRPTQSSDRDVSLDDYFDQLDAAFSKLGASNQSSTDVSDRTSLRVSGGDFDWLAEADRQPPESAAVPPVTESDNLDFSGVTGIDADRRDSHPRQEELAMPQPFTQSGAGRPSTSEKPAAPASAGPASRAPIADRFAALLAVEQGVPEAPSGAPSSPVVITDAIADQIVTKVLEKLSDKVVRDTVAEMVSRVAERLVREEIERIKGGKASP